MTKSAHFLSLENVNVYIDYEITHQFAKLHLLLAYSLCNIKKCVIDRTFMTMKLHYIKTCKSMCMCSKTMLIVVFYAWVNYLMTRVLPTLLPFLAHRMEGRK